jgi:hypothetical protein
MVETIMPLEPPGPIARKALRFIEAATAVELAALLVTLVAAVRLADPTALFDSPVITAMLWALAALGFLQFFFAVAFAASGQRRLFVRSFGQLVLLMFMGVAVLAVLLSHMDV